MSQSDRNNLCRTMYELCKVIVESNYTLGQPDVTTPKTYTAIMRMFTAMDQMFVITKDMKDSIIEKYISSQPTTEVSGRQPTISTPTGYLAATPTGAGDTKSTNEPSARDKMSLSFIAPADNSERVG
ncbi:hypothetical protein LZ30DRAFT_721528 [Colletotrichum cereale]|nr:hypothetical protein LZ30DRAFT_721528 [Colletotrichum cereale]